MVDPVGHRQTHSMHGKVTHSLRVPLASGSHHQCRPARLPRAPGTAVDNSQVCPCHRGDFWPPSSVHSAGLPPTAIALCIAPTPLGTSLCLRPHTPGPLHLNAHMAHPAWAPGARQPPAGDWSPPPGEAGPPTGATLKAGPGVTGFVRSDHAQDQHTACGPRPPQCLGERAGRVGVKAPGVSHLYFIHI